MCPHTTITTERGCYARRLVHASTGCYICVLILLVCPHTTISVSSITIERGCYARRLVCAIYASSYYYIYVSAYYYICVLILLHMRPAYYYLCVSSYYYICVRILRTQDLSGIGFHDLTVPDDMWAPLNVRKSSAVILSLLALLVQEYKY